MPNLRRTEKLILNYGRALFTLGALVVALAGCGSGSGSSTVPTSRATTTAPSASTSASSGEDCGGVVGQVKTAVAAYPEITKVQTIAGCTEVDIDTNLPSGVLGSPSATRGSEICEAAAKVAYQGDVSSITVTATDGHEIAAGLKSADCLPG
jgi:hypothetical protein